MSILNKKDPSRKEKKKRKSQEPQTLAEFFGNEGPLAQLLPGYELREEQLRTSEAVEKAMEEGLPCIAEAGTGVGKTLAYLIPAVRAAYKGKRTVISTHTINLQNQLMQKDIPLVLRLFPDSEERIFPVLLKGRGNYLCKLELDNAHDDLFLMADPQFHRVEQWARKEYCGGDLAELPFTFPNWYELTSTPETCRGQECKYYNSCFYYKVRFAAMESNLIVVNHALFLSDLALRLSDPNAGILPNYDHVVFDEAHHLEDVATRTFGTEFTSRRIAILMDKLRHVRGLDIDKARLQTIEDTANRVFAPFQQVGRSEFYFEDALGEESRPQVEAETGIACNSISELQNDIMEIAKQDETLKERLEGIARLCGRAREELHQIFFQKDENAIRWAEVIQQTRSGKRESRIHLHLTPISIADILDQALWQRMEMRGSVTLISATLANSGGFSFLRQRLGVPENAVECIEGSPFHYKKQAMLYVPGHLPEPSPSSAYTDKLVAEIDRIVRLTEGRAFLLFTSRAMLNAVYERLNGTLPFPLFRQGDLPPNKLLENFRMSGNGCLLGAQTFWEGVDVQGESLSCVIIDRLPFAVPDTPITKARSQAIVEAGGDWFRDYAVPQAQIRLKQGFGRLIRTRTDHGIVCILDSRLIHKNYGAEFVRYLPQASRASKWERVERFWHSELHPKPKTEESNTEGEANE